jgi:hypothetical protein
MQEYHDLCEFASNKYGIDVRKDRSRKAGSVRIRHAIGKILSVNLGYTLTEIGKQMGVDHTVIVYCRSLHHARYQSDQAYAKVHDELEAYKSPTDESLNAILEHIRQIA